LNRVPAHWADLELCSTTITETLVFAGHELNISKAVKAEGAGVFLDAQPLEGGKLDWARQDLLGFRIQLRGGIERAKRG